MVLAGDGSSCAVSGAARTALLVVAVFGGCCCDGIICRGGVCCVSCSCAGRFSADVKDPECCRRADAATAAMSTGLVQLLMCAAEMLCIQPTWIARGSHQIAGGCGSG